MSLVIILVVSLPQPDSNVDDSATLNFVEQVIRHSTKIDIGGIVSQPSPIPDFSTSHHCFICPAWFQSDAELSEHLAQHSEHHNDLAKTGEKMDITFMEDLEASLLEKPVNPVNPETLIEPSPSSTQNVKKVKIVTGSRCHKQILELHRCPILK